MKERMLAVKKYPHPINVFYIFTLQPQIPEYFIGILCH